MPNMKTDAVITPYKKQSAADASDLKVYLDRELSRMETTLSQLVNLSPQVATSAPKVPLQGMIRFAKAPWNPLATGDVLVVYKAGAWIAA